MQLTLPVLYLAVERIGWCQFLRLVPLVGGEDEVGEQRQSR